MDTIEFASVFGVVPTSFVVNERNAPPAEAGLQVWCHPIDKKLGAFGEEARNYTLVQNADALICTDRNDHLLRVARQYGLVIYEE